MEAAQAAGRTKGTYLGVQYHRLAARRGKKKAVVALGHTVPVTAYHLLGREQDYVDLDPQYFERRERAAVERRSVRRPGALGYLVTLEPPTSATSTA